MPVGCIQPSFHDSKMHKKIRIEKPTRKASALNILLVLGLVPVPSLNMYNRAKPRLPIMAAKAMMTMIFMNWIIQ